MTSSRTAARVAVVAGGCGVVLAAAPAAAYGQTVGYTASVYAVRGTYPTERVDSVYVFNGVDVTGGPVRLGLTVPFVRIETTPAAATSDDAAPVLASTSTGVADPLLRIDVRVWDDRARAFQVGLAGAVKLPVVDATSGRGTGEADYGVGASAFKTMTRTSVMADVLFWKYGDPEGVDFANTWSYSAGVAQVVGSGRFSAMGSISGFSSGVGDLPPPVALNLSVLSLIGRRQSLAVSASIGLNDSTSDFSIGMSWRIAR